MPELGVGNTTNRRYSYFLVSLIIKLILIRATSISIFPTCSDIGGIIILVMEGDGDALKFNPPDFDVLEEQDEGDLCLVSICSFLALKNCYCSSNPCYYLLGVVC